MIEPQVRGAAVQPEISEGRSVQPDRGWTSLRINGPLTASTAAELRETLRRHAQAGGARLLLDLRCVSAIDLYGVAALVFGLRTIEAQRGGMRLVMNDLVARALKKSETLCAFSTCRDQ
ncbi:MAG TPA: STAS domain-containing protein [Methylomirabilota bacterium]|nr:STAS domain-containing protein [Methylomirabilota bacterium]